MKVLLDECVPWPLHRLLVGHNCASPRHRGWDGIQNGALLRLAEGEFDLFVTSDQNLRYQQTLSNRSLRILELSTNDWRRIQAAAGLVTATIREMPAGEYRQLLIP